jgi:hypothetical protein
MNFPIYAGKFSRMNLGIPPLLARYPAMLRCLQIDDSALHRLAIRRTELSHCIALGELSEGLSSSEVLVKFLWRRNFLQEVLDYVF